MDNSPLWDDALDRMSLDPARIPEYERVDVRVADASERPSDAEYDRYVYLVGLFRELAYEPSRIRDAVPFALQPVLFNSLLVRSNQDLAEIARVLGSDADPFEAWAESTAPAWTACGTTSGRCTWTTTSSPRSEWASPRRPVSRRCMRASRTRSRAERMVERLADSRVPRRRLGLGRHEPLARRSGLPADALLARAGVADPELGAPARLGALRVPGARRAGAARRRRARRGARASGSTTTRSPARATVARSSPGPPVSSSTSSGRRRRRESREDGNIDFDRISCYTRMTNRVERRIQRTDRRNVARVHPRSAGSKVTSSACGCPSGNARCISAQEGPL